MTEAQLMTELAECCRRLACYQRNPNILDMLHDLEEDFIQEAADRNLRPEKRLIAVTCAHMIANIQSGRN